MDDDINELDDINEMGEIPSEPPNRATRRQAARDAVNANGKAHTPGHAERIEALEREVAEQKQILARMATALATLLASAMQPQMQQQVLTQLMGGGGSAPTAGGPPPVPVSTLIAAGRPLSGQPPATAVAT
jgi:uncharacterized coiled-coil protein SlyX